MRAASVLVAVLLMACGRTPQPDEPTPVATAAPAEPAAAEAESVAQPARPTESSTTNSQREPNLVLAVDEEVTTGDDETIVLRSFVIEDIAPDPEDPHSSPGGGGLVLQVEVDGDGLTFSDLPAAYGSTKVAWSRGLRLELVDYDTRASSARFYLDRVTERAIHRRQITVAKGSSVELDDGWTMKFEGHGHKNVSRGQRSPLLIHVSYSMGSGSPDKQRYSLYTTAPEQRTWTWHDYQFRLEDHQYDQSMDLSVRRMQLEPAEIDDGK